jgi:pilus assembly protein CpaC
LKIITKSLVLFLLLVCNFIPAQFAVSANKVVTPIKNIEIDTGHAHIIKLKGVVRIAVGNSQILQASHLNGREIILFAKQAGLTSVDVWVKNGERQSFRVQVKSAEISHVHQEVSELLAEYPDAKSKVVGRKIVIEGQHLSDQTRARIKGLAERFPDIIDLTEQMGWDRMVLIDVQVLELPHSKMKELGVRWDPATQGGLYTGLAWDGRTKGVSIPSVPQPIDQILTATHPFTPAAALGFNGLLSARLQALSQKGEAVMLAQPQLLARSGSAASFLAGGEVPYSSIDKDGKSTTTFRKYGVSLQVTPHVDALGAIRARVEVEVSSIDPSIQTNAGPAMKVRKASTEFNVQSGQTLVLGGFISREKASDQSGVPGLSDIPILGGLFGVSKTQSRHTELAIFVTPVLVSPRHPDLMNRVDQGQQIIQQTFPEPARLQLPIRPDLNAHQNVKAETNQSSSEHLYSQWLTKQAEVDYIPGRTQNVLDFND